MESTESSESMQQTNGKNENSKGTTQVKNGAPKGYTKRGTEIVGYLNPDLGGVHIIPHFAKLFDGNINKSKPAILLVCELVDASDAIVTKGWEEGKPTVATKPGDQIGIWYKPGMAAIKSLGGQKCYLEYERDANGKVVKKKIPNKPSPMPMFAVSSNSTMTAPIPVLEDTRRESANVDTPFAPAKSATPLPPLPAATASDSADDTDEFQSKGTESDIPF